MTQHKIRWYARIPIGSQEAPDGWLPRTAQMRGTWGWDVRCSCGMETRTGGATRSAIRELIWLHKVIRYDYSGWWPIKGMTKVTHISPRPAMQTGRGRVYDIPMSKEIAVSAEQYNHIFRTFLGIPPTKGDKPLCGADLSDAWDFPGHARPLCPACQEAASNG